MQAAVASKNFGLNAHATFSGALAWPYLYPWPQRPEGLVDEAFNELAKRWKPILNKFDEAGVDLCYEIHPGEDLHDGVTFERFLKETGNHKRANILYDPSHFVLQQLDYLDYIDHYHSFIKSFHVKDSEFNPTGKKGAFGGYGDWIDRAGRYRSLGDGQIDFKSIFTKLTEYGCDVWAVMEWECCIKSPEQGAREGARSDDAKKKKMQERSPETKRMGDIFGGNSTGARLGGRAGGNLNKFFVVIGDDVNGNRVIQEFKSYNTGLTRRMTRRLFKTTGLAAGQLKG